MYVFCWRDLYCIPPLLNQFPIADGISLILEVCLLPLDVYGLFLSPLLHIFFPSSSFKYGEGILHYIVVMTCVARIYSVMVRVGKLSSIFSKSPLVDDQDLLWNHCENRFITCCMDFISRQVDLWVQMAGRWLPTAQAGRLWIISSKKYIFLQFKGRT